MLAYVLRDLWRNPRRTLASLVGVTLGVGLLSGVLFFVDASAATMTQRAIAPLALDMQCVLESPLGRRLRFDERVSAPTSVRAGQIVTFVLSVVNETTDAVHEVVINDEPPPPLLYVKNSTTVNGVRIPDRAGSPLAQGPARIGLNTGTLAPGQRISVTYMARANRNMSAVDDLRLQGSISSREDIVPVPANAALPLTLQQLRTRISKIQGLEAADGLSYVDLPPDSVRAGRATLHGPIRVFSFEQAYQRHYPSIRVFRGSFRPGSALISAEAARSLGIKPGTVLMLRVPGRLEPLRLPVSGVTDLAQARPLFSSRKASKLDDFLYVPFTLIVSPVTFEHEIVPSFRVASAAQGAIVRNLPVAEVDVAVDRSRLRADPAAALAQTKDIARAIRGIEPNHNLVIDNISNALEVARDDAVVGTRMFLFLGLPGMLLGMFLTVFGANIHAEAQRREHATLRLHGADRAHLSQILVFKAVALAGAGASMGTVLGMLSVVSIMGRDSLFAAAGTDLMTSVLIAFSVGVLITTFAFYLPGHRSLRQAVSDERKELTDPIAAVWHRWRFDVAVLAVAAAATALQFVVPHPPVASVSDGKSVSLPSRLMLAPFAIWVGGTLFSVRVILAMTKRLPVAEPPRFGPLLRGLLVRSLRRRARSFATGTVAVTLVVAFGTNLAIFAATYDRAKAADSRFVVGSDIRITPSAQSERRYPTSYSDTLHVAGVAAVTPVVFKLENAVLIGPFNQDRMDMAAIEPNTFGQVASPSGAGFINSSTMSATAALANNVHGLLVRSSRADELSVKAGDHVQVLLARGTKQQTLESFRIVGVFETFPGFPQGIDLVANIAFYQSATSLSRTDFFLARASDPSPAGLARAVAAIQSGPGRHDPLRIDTTATALNKDQSSLTAVNVSGLVDLNSFFAMMLGTAAVAMIVFGLQLQRRREYLTLRAYGLSTPRLFALVLSEATIVAACGLAAGTVVGFAMARAFVGVLRPLFILYPPVTPAAGPLVLLGGVLMTATLVSAASATAILRHQHLPTLLRDP